MSFPSLSLPGQLPPDLRMELERVLAGITAWMRQEHSETGTHVQVNFPHGARVFEQLDTTTGTYRIYTRSSNGTVSGPY